MYAGTAAMFVTRTRYSSWPPASAAPPPTTATCLVMVSCWALPTTITVGSGPVVGSPSPSVGSGGSWTVLTTPWLLISVPAGTPALTCTSNVITALAPTESVPPPGPGSGGVRSDELIPMPATSGETPPSGCPTASPFRLVVFATYVVFVGTASVKTALVAGTAPVL